MYLALNITASVRVFWNEKVGLSGKPVALISDIRSCLNLQYQVLLDGCIVCNAKIQYSAGQNSVRGQELPKM